MALYKEERIRKQYDQAEGRRKVADYFIQYQFDLIPRFSLANWSLQSGDHETLAWKDTEEGEECAWNANGECKQSYNNKKVCVVCREKNMPVQKRCARSCRLI